MKKCLKEKFAEWPADETGLKCNPTAVQFQHCLWKEYERSCPQSEQKDSKRCNKLRAALKEQSTLKKRS
uniref:Odorant binding protein 9 n=1 Tax=Drosicha corpulenta TaxID=535978 RepID=A0A0U3UYU7_9HEMI|nr:odorant binding protein 9 [Drosicha corpulenta]